MARFLYLRQGTRLKLELQTQHSTSRAALPRERARLSRNDRALAPLLMSMALCFLPTLLSGCGGGAVSTTGGGGGSGGGGGGGTGGGGSGATYEVDLSWTTPASSNPIAGYYVFREDSTGGSTYFEQLNFAMDETTVYTDSHVQSGVSYAYFVIAVDTLGNYSLASNVTAEQVP